MKKIIIICFVIIGLLFSFGVVYAGQEDICYHDNFQIIYNSNKEQLKIFCNDCGETMNFKIDANFIKKIFW